MPKRHVKKGDDVVVLTGTERGKRGKVIEVITKSERVIVEGLKNAKAPEAAKYEAMMQKQIARANS